MGTIPCGLDHAYPASVICHDSRTGWRCFSEERAVLSKAGVRANTGLAGALRRGFSGAGAALATTDGRWALVSTSLTALVAGSLAWMAVGMMQVSRPMVAPGRSSLPY